MNHRIYHGLCQNVVRHLPHAQMAFLDPPDNIGAKYRDGGDNMPFFEYKTLLSECIMAATKKADTTWISFNSRHLETVASITRGIPLELKPCVQVFTFGQHNHHDLGNCYRPLWRLKHFDAPLYPDQVRVESWRQKNGDRRADLRGRIPGDVFDFPRVTGNSKQRRKWHPTQLHEGLIERCIKLSTKEGNHVIDMFGGTGTVLRVCQRLNRVCSTIEASGYYCQMISEETGVPVCSV